MLKLLRFKPLRFKPRKRWGLVLLGLLTWYLVISVWQAPIVHSAAHSNAKLRGVWMTHLGAALMFQTTQLDETIAQLAQQQVNTLYPAVWNQGHTLYSSAVMAAAGDTQKHNPWLYLPFVPQPDMLTHLAQQSHRQHLRLIPWFEYGLMIPTDAAVIRQHPDWLTTTQTGQTVLAPEAPSAHPISMIRKAIIGQDPAWLNPFHPAVQQFLVALITEVVQRYDVNGIQLDDHFGLPIEFGYDAYTVGLYKASHKGQAPPPNPADPEWMKWRADRLTDLMGQIVRSVKQAKPSAVISLSPNLPEFAYRTSLQDWSEWVRRDWLDEVVVQVYRPDIASFTAVLDRPDLQKLAQQVPLSIGIYTGPWLKPKPRSEVRQAIQAVRQRPYAGMAFFCWESTFWGQHLPANEADHPVKSGDD
jgi:uncharacterized lipoprotein YddW (UPF0748 family)